MKEPKTRDAKKPEELSDDLLDKVSAGVTKAVDASSPTLYKFCCTGKHFP